jgi:peptidoglycan/xylan/chitin deacetylase (PgdA/CDA1 family)
MGWKSKVIGGLSAMGVPRFVRLFPNQHLLIFNYHRIIDRRAPTLFDDGVFGPDPEGFEAQMRWLKLNSDVLSESDLLAACDGRRSWRGTCTAVTFDDGYRDCYSLAYPILKAVGVPAIFFIPTDAITQGRLSWWDHIAYLVKSSKKVEFTFRGRVFGAGERASATTGELLKLWRSSDGLATRGFIEELATATGSALPSLDLERAQLMDWDQVREVAAGGIAIGSHTERHEILSYLPLEAQRRELVASKQIIERELGREIVSLAYPVGQYQHFNPETKRLAQECGYRMAFSFLTGTATRGRLDRFDIRRTCAPDDLGRLDLGCAFPDLIFRNSGPLSAPAPFDAASVSA